MTVSWRPVGIASIGLVVCVGVVVPLARDDGREPDMAAPPGFTASATGALTTPLTTPRAPVPVTTAAVEVPS